MRNERLASAFCGQAKRASSPKVMRAAASWTILLTLLSVDLTSLSVVPISQMHDAVRMTKNSRTRYKTKVVVPLRNCTLQWSETNCDYVACRTCDMLPPQTGGVYGNFASFSTSRASLRGFSRGQARKQICGNASRSRRICREHVRPPFHRNAASLPPFGDIPRRSPDISRHRFP